MHTTRKKNFTVRITNGDREAVRRNLPNASLSSVDRRAVARAAAREVLIEAKNTAEALNSLTADVPKATLHSWMQAHLKAA